MLCLLGMTVSLITHIVMIVFRPDLMRGILQILLNYFSNNRPAEAIFWFLIVLFGVFPLAASKSMQLRGILWLWWFWVAVVLMQLIYSMPGYGVSTALGIAVEILMIIQYMRPKHDQGPSRN